MGLTSSEKSAFKLFKSFYRYMYKFPIEWDDEYTQLRLVRPVFPTLIPYFTIAFLNICMSISGFGVALFFNKMDIGICVTSADAMVLAMAAYATGLVFVSVHTMIKAFFGVNISITMEESLLTGIYK